MIFHFSNAQGLENICMKSDDKIKPSNLIYIYKKKEEILLSVVLRRHRIITTKSHLPMYTICLLFVNNS